jgi:uncharacterized protein (TIGR00725 family)
MLRRLPIIGVFGQGTPVAPARAELAREVGAMLARLGAHLLTGGGYGIMEAVAQGFVSVGERAGFSIGIVPRGSQGAFDEPNRDREGRAYPNDFVEIPIMTPLPPREKDWRNMPARNHINVFTPDAVLALPGHVGTRNELDMTAAYRDQEAQRPEERRVVLVGPSGEFTPEHRRRFVHVTTVPAAATHLVRVLSAQGFRMPSEVIGERVV